MSAEPRNMRTLRLVDDAGPQPAARYERARRRAALVVVIFSAYLAVGTATALYHVVHVEEVRRFAESNTIHRREVMTRRGDVVDRNGVVLVTDIRSDSVTADPRWVRPPGSTPSELPASDPAVVKVKDKVARLVSRASGVPRAEVRERLDWNRGFVYLAKQIDALASRDLRAHIRANRLPGVQLEEAFARYYPKGSLAGVLLGRKAWSGSIEASFDSQLSGQKVEVLAYKDRHKDRLFLDGAPDPGRFAGRSLVLTLDEKIQAVAEKQLQAGVTDAKADKGVALVLDATTAEVLAWAVYPGSDPNDNHDKPGHGWRNPVVQDLFEPGSTMKVITMAAALEERKVELHTQFNVLGGFQTRGKVIRDSHPARDENWRIMPVLTAEQIIQHSSNVGISKVAMRLGKDTLHRYLRDFGFGRPTNSGLQGEIGGMLANANRWSLVQFANVSFGQGMAATPLQVATAFTAIASGGIYRRPRLLKAVLHPDGSPDRTFGTEKGRRVISERTSSQLIRAMVSVCGPGGTARAARLPDYTMAGKTGTAQQVDPGVGYSDTHWVASFVGMVPAERPRLVVFVAVDTPRKRHERFPDKVIRTGGAIAAPVAREIARFALPYLGVPHSPGAPWLAEDHPDKARRHAEAERKLASARQAQEDKQSAAAEVAAQEARERRDEPARPGMTRVPDLRGRTMRAARVELASAGLALSPIGSGVALKQRPAAGALVREGSQIQVFFRRFSELAAVGRSEGGEL